MSTTYRVHLTGPQIEALLFCAYYVQAGEWPFEDEGPSRRTLQHAIANLTSHHNPSTEEC